MDAIRQKTNDIVMVNSFVANANKILELLPISNISSIDFPPARVDMEFICQKAELLVTYNVLNSFGSSDILSKAYNNTSILPVIQPMERNALIVDAFKDEVTNFVEQSAVCSMAEALQDYPKLQSTSLDVKTISNTAALLDKVRQQANDIATLQALITNANKIGVLLPTSPISSIFLPPAKIDMEFIRNKGELLAEYNVINSVKNKDITNITHNNVAILPQIEAIKQNDLPINDFKAKAMELAYQNSLYSIKETMQNITNHIQMLPMMTEQSNNTNVLQSIREKAFAYTEQSIFIALGNAIKQRKTAQATQQEPSRLQIKQYFNKLQREYKHGQISLEQFQACCTKHPKLQNLFTDYQTKFERKQKLKADFEILQNLGIKAAEQPLPPPIESQQKHKGEVAKVKPQEIVEQKAEGTNEDNNTVPLHLRM